MVFYIKKFKIFKDYKVKTSIDLFHYNNKIIGLLIGEKNM